MLDQLREQTNQQQLAFTIVRALGSEADPPPTYDDAIGRLDELLAAPLVTGDDPQQQLRDALGLNRR
jgi:hypothetical protein